MEDIRNWIVNFFSGFGFREWGITIFATVAFLLLSIGRIPTGYVALRTRFLGKRTGKVAREGLCWKNIFLLERFEVDQEVFKKDPESKGYMSLEYRTLDLEDEKDRNPEFTTSDRIPVFAKGKLQWSPYDDDETIADIFWQWLNEDIEKGLRTAVKELLSAIFGCVTGDESIHKQQEITLFINASLCLDHDFCGEQGTKARFDWVCANMAVIEKELIEFHNGNRERSTIERQYGIDITAFHLDQIDYTEEYKKQMAKKAEAEQELAALQTREDIAKRKGERIKDLVAAGVDGVTATLGTERALGQELSQQVTSFGGARPVIVTGLPGGLSGREKKT